MKQDRGAEAQSPWRIPAPGWWDILCRTLKRTGERDLALVAGGVTYYLLLALFPALAALVSIYGLVADPADAVQSAHLLSSLLPPSVVTLISDELRQLVSVSNRGLSLGAATGIVIAIYSSVRGMSGMMQALNIAHGRTEQRGYIRFYGTALLLTVIIIIGGVITLALVAGLPAALIDAGTPGLARWTGLVVEWLLLIVFVAGIVSLIYRFGPDGRAPEWKWISLGVVTATLMWIVGSILFSIYVYHFASYNKTYGSLGIPLVLLTWMWLSVFVVLFGAEINGQAERQAHPDARAGSGG